MKMLNVLDEMKMNSVIEINNVIKNYLENYSFSTLDIILSKREILSLEIDQLYLKIIKGHRGGYCFEQNKLFNYFLEEKGFVVIKQLARVIYGKEIDAPRTHRINIVEIEGRDYLLDVGFGTHTPNALIPIITEEVVCPNGCTYRVTQDDRGLFSLEVKRDEGFFAFYTFDMGVYTEADFNLSSYYSNTNPKSKHAHNLVMSINDGEYTKVILNKSYAIYSKGQKIEENSINSGAEFESILLDHFKVKITIDEGIYLAESFID